MRRLVHACGAVGLQSLFHSFIFITSNPRITRRYERFSKKYLGGLGIVNGGMFSSSSHGDLSPDCAVYLVDPGLFTSLTPEEFSAAANALSKSDDQTKEDDHSRSFDLDIAKLLSVPSRFIFPHARLLSVL